MGRTIKKRAFCCKRDGLMIRGFEFMRSGEKTKKPAVIVSHGFMANQKTTRAYAETFAAWGFHAYTFDFNGGGLGSRSQGKKTEMSVLTEVKDLKAVIDYVTGLLYNCQGKVILMGCSQGGFVSALTAAEIGDRIGRLILFYPALCIPDDARKGSMMFARFDPEHIPDTFWCGPMKLGKVYPESVMDMDVMEAIHPYNGPVLIVHGSEDPIVNVSYAEQAAAAYQLRNVAALAELVLIPGAGHGFEKEEDRIAMAAVKNFLSRKQDEGDSGPMSRFRAN